MKMKEAAGIVSSDSCCDTRVTLLVRPERYIRGDLVVCSILHGKQ